MHRFEDRDFWRLLGIGCLLGGTLALAGHVVGGLALGAGILWLGLAGAGEAEREGSSAYSEARTRRLARSLQDGESPFDLARFDRRVRRAFLAVQDAWLRQDLRAARAFLSDGVAESLALRIAEQRAHGYRNPIEALRVLAVDLLEVRHTEHFDAVAVRITAHATDYRVALGSGEEQSGSRRSGRFYEVWSLIRRRGACPERGIGLMEGRCPNCRAPLDAPGGPLSPRQCASCGAGLRGVPSDWVLTKISHDLEWRHRAAGSLPGLAALHERDPGFTLEHLEDRAAVLFWRVLHADRAGEPSATGVQGPASTPSLGASLSGCALCSIDTRGFFEDPGWTRAVVEVRWAASGYRSRAGAWRDLRRPDRPLTHTLFVLRRRTEVRTRLEQCLLSARCGSCGAPASTLDVHECRHCGAPLEDGHGEWILDQVFPSLDAQARALLRRLEIDDEATGTTRGGLLAWAVALTHRDGPPKPAELHALERFARQLELPMGRLEELLAAANRRALSGRFPESPEQARAWLSLLAELALVDGESSAAERALLRALAQRSGIDGEWIESQLG